MSRKNFGPAFSDNRLPDCCDFRNRASSVAAQLPDKLLRSLLWQNQPDNSAFLRWVQHIAPRPDFIVFSLFSGSTGLYCSPDITWPLNSRIGFFLAPSRCHWKNSLPIAQLMRIFFVATISSPSLRTPTYNSIAIEPSFNRHRRDHAGAGSPVNSAHCLNKVRQIWSTSLRHHR